MDLEFLKKETNSVVEFARDARRSIHSHPELSGKEIKTCEFVCSKLDELGVEYHVMDDIHAVVALISSGKPGKTIGIRADMDALPITENNELEFKSQCDGVMHACGHDMHTAILLGTAAVLSKNRDKFSGNVKLFFQPSEEGSGGALPMIERGCMENPHVDASLALHVSPELDAGTFGTMRGYVNACTGSLTVDVYGSECHGAHPEGGVDAVLIASQLISAIYALPCRRVSATDPLMITIGTIHGGTATNIVCGHVTMKMTLRTINRDTRKRFIEEIRKLVTDTCSAFGGRGELQVSEGYINLKNDSKMCDRFEKLSEQLVGEGSAIEHFEPSMGGEDFSYFGEYSDAFMYDLGIGFPGKEKMSLHSCNLIANEDAIYYGILMHSAFAMDYLNE